MFSSKMSDSINKEGDRESSIGKQIWALQDHGEGQSRPNTMQKAQHAANPDGKEGRGLREDQKKMTLMDYLRCLRISKQY